MRCVSFLGLTGLLLANPPLTGAQLPQAKHVADTLAIDDVLGMRTFNIVTQVTLSPSGRWVAFTVRDPHGSFQPAAENDRVFTARGRSTLVNGAELWVVDTRSRAARNLTGPRGVSWGGVWSPDGQFLAYFSDRSGVPQLWLWNAASNRSQRLSPAAVRIAYSWELPRWTPDSRFVVAKLKPDIPDTPAKSDDRQISAAPRDSTIVRVFPQHAGEAPTAANSALIHAWDADLGIINARTGEVRRLARSVPIPSYEVSPDGSAIAFMVLRGSDYGAQDMHMDLNVVDLHSGKIRTRAHDLVGVEYGRFTWSPTSTALAYVATSYDGEKPEDCFVIPLATGAPINITPAHHPRFGDDTRGPLWSRDGKSLFVIGSDTLWSVATDGSGLTPVASVAAHHLQSLIAPAFGVSPWSPPGASTLFVTTRDTGSEREGVAKVDPQTHHVELLFEDDVSGPGAWLATYKIDAVGSRVVFPLQRADQPEDLWLADSAFASRRRFTDLNPALARYQFGTTRRITWLSLDGETLHGVVLLPPGYTATQRYPAVVWVYGGIHTSGVLNQFGVDPYAYNMQIFATRGYVVLYPDAPQHLGTPMADLAKTVLPGVNRLVELGIADSTRIGVGGYSYGGYSTLALITQTHRFRAAVAIAAVGVNLLTEYTLLDERGYSWGIGWAERGQGLMGATPWERRDRYIENSPFFYLDRVTTPLLLIHGNRDDPVLDRQTYSALRRLGADVTYAEYSNVRHVFNEAPLVQQRDYYERVLAWYGAHLAHGSIDAHR